MKIKAYTCPSCGAPLDVNYDTTFTFCPQCGCRLHISYEGGRSPKIPTCGSSKLRIPACLWPAPWFPWTTPWKAP